MTERELLSDVVSRGDIRESLIAIRDRLADEADDTRWAQHKAECKCSCGIGDGRTLVAVVKELRVVIVVIDSLPSDKEASGLDDLRDRRARRIAATAGTDGSAVRDVSGT